MPPLKLCLVAKRLNHELDTISSDFATWPPPSRLAILRQKRRRLADLASSCKEKRDEHDWQAGWQNLGHSTCPSRGASAHYLGSGVPYALLHGVVETSVRGKPTRFTDGQGSFAVTWRRRRMGLERLERVGISLLCGPHCLHPTSLASLGRAWGTTLVSWTSRCNGGTTQSPAAGRECVDHDGKPPRL